MKKTNLVAIIAASFLFASSSVLANAAPHFTLTPPSGSYTVGSEFTVDLGIDSETEKVVAVDLVGTFNKDLLELVKMENIPNTTGFLFNWDPATTPKINNTTGVYSATLTPSSATSLSGVSANHGLVKLTFKAKSAGVANVALTCQQGSVNDTNILNPSSVDVTTCSSNQTGSYTISGTATTTTTTPTPTPTQTQTAVTTSATKLPETGSLSATVGLIVFGAICVVGALFVALL